jgi:uncharacterized FAD-dependent dehydrogenase
MLKTEFKSQLEFDIYLTEQKIRQENQYLSRSERETLKKMLEKDYKPTFIKEEKTKFPIVTNINELKNPCTEVVKEDNIKEIIQKLKDTLESNGGLGLTANQIDIQKRISYIKVPKYNKEKKIEFNEYILRSGRQRGRQISSTTTAPTGLTATTSRASRAIRIAIDAVRPVGDIA